MRNHKLPLKTKSGNVIDAKVDTLKQEGLFPSANIVNDLAEYNASNALAAVSALAAPAVGMMLQHQEKQRKAKLLCKVKTLLNNNYNIGSNKLIRKPKLVS